jgi:molecular chaperone DnaK (HSP70)
MKASDVDVVMLAGGSTLLSAVQEGVEAYFGKRGAIGMDPTEVVAIGASIAPI